MPPSLPQAPSHSRDRLSQAPSSLPALLSACPKSSLKIRAKRGLRFQNGMSVTMSTLPPLAVRHEASTWLIPDSEPLSRPDAFLKPASSQAVPFPQGGGASSCWIPDPLCDGPEPPTIMLPLSS